MRRITALNDAEDELLDAYRQLDTLAWLSVRRFIWSGDSRLVTCLFDQWFLGLPPPAPAEDERLDEVGEFSGTVEFQQLPLIWG